MNEDQNKQNEESMEGKDNKPKPSKKGNVPTTEIDLGKVGKNVSKKWKENPWLTLLWTNEIDFSSLVTNYNSVLSSRLKVGASRPQVTNELNNLDLKIDKTLLYVKNYIVDKYKKEAAKSYYAAFGFLHKKDAYIFPQDQNSRLEALERMVEAIEEHGFEDKEFGLAFWKEIQVSYETNLEAALEKDGLVSTKVGNKNVLKKQLKTALNSIVLVITANYPETYKEQLRNWGFQKEKY